LSIYCDDISIAATNFNVVIQNGQPNYPHFPAVDSDFYYGNYVNNGGQIATTAMTDTAYSDIILNTNGKNWINKGGNTKFCLRSSRDIAVIEPTGSEWIEIYPTDVDFTYKPKM